MLSVYLSNNVFYDLSKKTAKSKKEEKLHNFLPLMNDMRGGQNFHLCN